MNDLDPADAAGLSDILQHILSELDATEDIKLPWPIEEDLDHAYALLRSVQSRI